MEKAKIGIIGAAGYTGGELIRLLLWHPHAEIAYVHSRSRNGVPVSSIHTDLFGDTDLLFTDTVSTDIDVLFLCLPHGETAHFLTQHTFPDTVKFIDLSNDFRLGNEHGFVYGLPELQRSTIHNAMKVANPGCFATAIQLALLPLAHSGILHHDVHVTATTGSTGAGVKPADTLHFTWRHSNMSIYKAFTHQHLAEIKQSLHSLQPGFNHNIQFIPHRGDFTRGIIASVYTPYNGTLEDARALYRYFYTEHYFTHVSDENIDLKQVVNTNKCLLYLEKHGDQLLIVSIIDNLLKGASGQAVQNLNLMMGWEETTGLRLKGSAY